MKKNESQFDFLVIGSGIAGLFFALRAAEHGTVAIVTKKKGNDSNTNFAQGGIACVNSDEDSFNLHVQDTMKAGAGLCDKEAVEVMVREGPDCIQELISVGTHFSKTNQGDLELGREGGHSRNRIVHAKDLTGKEVEETLLANIKKHKNISFFENHMAIELISPEKTCQGAWILSDLGEVKLFWSKITLLASGGCGQLFQHTTNPDIATGNGIALAYRAGAKIKDLEFIQFHPTTLYHPLANSFLISEALRGAGAIIVNKKGEDFIQKTDSRGSLASRDIVARAIDAELKNTGEPCAYLDATLIPKDKLIKDFPNIYQTCLKFGLDISKDKIPVVPAAHYMCGGVSVDLQARTTVKNLYACGEVASTGVHGANRLASNSLLEALVFSKRAALHSTSVVDGIQMDKLYPLKKKFMLKTFSESDNIFIRNAKMLLKQIMTSSVGIVRSNEGMKQAKELIELLQKSFDNRFPENEINYELCELRNMLLVSELIIDCAIKRKNNVGLHFNVDIQDSKSDLIQRALKN